MSQSIFVSYRRSDATDICGRICDRLVEAFGEENVFQDVESLPPGSDFGLYIRKTLARCRVVLVLVGRGWIGATDARGGQRLADAADWVRIEVETALNDARIITIPVLLATAEMPNEAELPNALHLLRARNSVRVRPDPDFDHDMARLISALRAELPHIAKSTQTPEPGGRADGDRIAQSNSGDGAILIGGGKGNINVNIHRGSSEKP